MNFIELQLFHSAVLYMSVT